MLKNTESNWLEKFLSPEDLPSMKTTLLQHLLNSGTIMKYYRTDDPETINLMEELISQNSFLKEMIMTSAIDKNFEQTSSIRVEICNISNHPRLEAAHRKWRALNRSRMISVGGPAATDQTLLSLLVPEIKVKTDIEFYCRSFKESNLMYSGLQSHARQASAINEYSELTGRNVLFLLLKRWWHGEEVEDVCRDGNYLKLNVNLWKFQYYPVYFMNEFHGLWQKAKQYFGFSYEHHMNRVEAVVSQELFKIVEREAGIQLVLNHNKNLKKSMAIGMAFNLTPQEVEQRRREETLHYNETKQVVWEEIPMRELRKIFPQARGISIAWRFQGDYTIHLDTYEKIKNRSVELGAKWAENNTLSKVFLDKDPQTGRLYTCGLAFADGEFVPADKIHLTLGYKVDYFYEGTDKRCLKNIVVPATGLSSHIIFRRTPEIDRIIKENGSLEISSTIGHCTFMTWNENYVLARALGGGNLGFQGYRPIHALEIFANMRRVFGDAFIGIYDVYGCSRSVNYKNSTQIAQLADGLVISYGKGGTGNSKRTSEAYKVLKYLGYGEELKKFMSQRKVDHFGYNLHQTIEEICEESRKTDLFYDREKHVEQNLF